jgi:hypothetical protein
MGLLLSGAVAKPPMDTTKHREKFSKHGTKLNVQIEQCRYREQQPDQANTHL